MAAGRQVGDVIAERWEIHRVHGGAGASGMGVVYGVYDREWRQVLAAKTYQDEVFARNPETAGRFIREATAWVRLDSHPNIVSAQMVQVIGGKPYLFLDYVAGGDLSRRIGTARLMNDSDQLLRFAINFCDGMIHAGAKGITAHRDIKPQNCLITADGVLQVTDFGLAKAVEGETTGEPVEIPQGKKREKRGGRFGWLRGGTPRQADPEPTGITHTGMAQGTAPYMAPEQFIDAKRVDVRADIYAFGVLVFEMVTGELPYGRPGWNWGDFARAHRSAPLPAFDGWHPSLCAIVAKCLAKNPLDRYPDFAAVRSQLAALYEAVTGRLAPQPATGAALTVVQWTNKGTSLTNLGRGEEALACYDAALEIGPNHDLPWLNKGVALGTLGRTEEELACYERAVKLNPSNIKARNHKGAVLVELNRADEALAWHAATLAEKLGDAETWLRKGEALAKLGRLEEAVVSFDESLARNPNDPDAWFQKGLAFAALDRFADGLECYWRSVELDDSRTDAWCNAGLSLNELSRPDAALGCFDRALAHQPGHLGALSGKGLALVELGHFDEALRCFDRELELVPNDIKALNNKGLTLGHLGRVEDALRSYDRALEVDPTYPDTWFNKAGLLFTNGDSAGALECVQRVVSLSPNDADAWNLRGQRCCARSAMRTHWQPGIAHWHSSRTILVTGTTRASHCVRLGVNPRRPLVWNELVQ